MAQEQGNCSHCGKPLVTRPWNSVTDVSFCDNSNCPEFHRPLKPIEGARPTRKKSAHAPSWLTEPSPYVLRVRKLRDKLLYGDDE